jgi:hypothetical protein
MRLGERAGSLPQNEGPADTIRCSSFIQNMSCRPRTTVRSARLTPSKVPEGLKGDKIIIDPARYLLSASLKSYAERNPGMSVPIFNALLTLGLYRRHSRTYERFIRSRAAHKQSLMRWVLRVPEEIAGFPGVGFIKRPGTCDGLDQAATIKSLHATLFIMARANRAVYIRDKSPLLSLISTGRRLQIVFVGQRS